jgi:hypothetical protein
MIAELVIYQLGQSHLSDVVAQIIEEVKKLV